MTKFPHYRTEAETFLKRKPASLGGYKQNGHNYGGMQQRRQQDEGVQRAEVEALRQEVQTLQQDLTTTKWQSGHSIAEDDDEVGLELDTCQVWDASLPMQSQPAIDVEEIPSNNDFEGEEVATMLCGNMSVKQPGTSKPPPAAMYASALHAKEAALYLPVRVQGTTIKGLIDTGA